MPLYYFSKSSSLTDSDLKHKDRTKAQNIDHTVCSWKELSVPLLQSSDWLYSHGAADQSRARPTPNSY